MNFEYDDIINLPHHRSSRRRQMPRSDRAAQFAPFAALAGYDAEIMEKGRLTTSERFLSEYQQDALDEKLQYLMEIQNRKPCVTIVLFRPDPQKDGGSYMQITGILKQIDPARQLLILDDGTQILLESIVDVALGNT